MLTMNRIADNTASAHSIAVHPQRNRHIRKTCAVYGSGMRVQQVKLPQEEVHAQHREEDKAQNRDLAGGNRYISCLKLLSSNCFFRLQRLWLEFFAGKGFRELGKRVLRFAAFCPPNGFAPPV